MVISGVLQVGSAAWRYCGPPVKASPSAWLFKNTGEKAPGKALSVCVLLQLCSTAVPCVPQNDTAPIKDYLGYRNEDFWGWTVPWSKEKTRNSTGPFSSVFSAGERQTRSITGTNGILS